MSKFRRTAVFLVVFELILAIISWLYISGIANDHGENEYRVEISRIANRMRNGEMLETIDLSEYKSIVKVEMFSSDKDSRYEYRIENVNGTLYRFDYQKDNSGSVAIIAGGVLLLFILITIAILIYLERKVISPFSRMNNLTTELAKGNLSVPITEEKSKYFGKFLWGMDMLREKLEDDRERELELLKDRKTLILSLSHDIKTPLSAIDLYTKALKTDLYETKEERLTAIEGIESNVVEIKRYVGEIANASREDFMSLNVNNSEVYLSEVLSVIELYYEGKLAKLHTEFKLADVDNCLIYGDCDRIVEVMQNVIENAIKYGDGKRISIDFDEEENCKLITIANTGCSLKGDELPNIFDSFIRGSNVQNKSGSGLGLYICRELIHKMDGEIFAKIVDDEFRITLVLRKM